MVLNDGKGHTGADSEQGDDAGEHARDILCELRPKRHHGPGLVHEGGLDNDDERESERVGGEAEVVVVLRDLREVARPELVEVALGGKVVSEEEATADSADKQAEQMKDSRETGELRRWGECEDDKKHDDARAELGAIVHGDANGLVIDGVDHRYGNFNCSVMIGIEEGDVLGVRIKGWLWRGGRSIHGEGIWLRIL